MVRATVGILTHRVPIMKSRVSTDPKIHFGKPCVAGTRITVENVLELVRAGLSPDEIRRDYYPDLTDSDIQVCVEFSRDAD